MEHQKKVDAFMRDEENLAKLWEKASTYNPDDADDYERACNDMYVFLQRTWAVKGDLDSLERYANRVSFFVRHADPGNTFVRRYVDDILPLIEEVRRLRKQCAAGQRHTAKGI